MRITFLISITLLIVHFSYGQSHSLYDNWNIETLNKLKKQKFTHESISSDSLRNLFLTLIDSRKDTKIDRINVSNVDVISVIEIIDYSKMKIIRKERFIDWAHSDTTYLFDSTGYALSNSRGLNRTQKWKYKKTLNLVRPRCFYFWTGSCIGGLKSDFKKAKQFEEEINSDTTFIENYLKIETQIMIKTGKTKVAFFVPKRGKRCVNPVSGLVGDGLPEELILYDYFEQTKSQALTF